jgi:hypothetical protein
LSGQLVTQAANDEGTVEADGGGDRGTSGQRPAAVLADSGYCSEENLRYLESADKPEKKIDGYIATGKQKHGSTGNRASGARCRGDAGGPMMRKLQTKAGRAVYAARKCVVEPVFGQIKQARGIRHLLRGIRKFEEWALVRLTHNILRLYAAHQAQ